MTGVVVTKLAVQLKDGGDQWFPVLAITGPVPGVGSAGKQGGMFLIARPAGAPAVEWIGVDKVTRANPGPPREGESSVTWA